MWKVYKHTDNKNTSIREILLSFQLRRAHNTDIKLKIRNLLSVTKILPVGRVSQRTNATVRDITPAGINVGQALTMGGRMEENTVPSQSTPTTTENVQLLQKISNKYSPRSKHPDYNWKRSAPTKTSNKY